MLASFGYLEHPADQPEPGEQRQAPDVDAGVLGQPLDDVRLSRGLTLGGGLRYMDEVFVNAPNTIRVPSYCARRRDGGVRRQHAPVAAAQRQQHHRQGLHQERQQQRRPLQPGHAALGDRHVERAVLRERHASGDSRSPDAPNRSLGARELLDTAEWVDGTVTAGPQSARAKNNQQLPEGSAAAESIGDMILTALQRNALFVSAALPLRVFPPLFNRYQGGQAFGNHVDNAIRQIRARVTASAPTCPRRCFSPSPTTTTAES